MRLLVVTGTLYPIPSNNANLLSKLLPILQKHHEVRILSTTLREDFRELPAFFQGIPVYWIDQYSVVAFKRAIVFPIISKLRDSNGNSDLLNMMYIREKLKQIKQEYPFDAVLSTSEPYPAADALSSEKAKKVLYLMDPPELVRNETGTAYRNRNLLRILSAQDTILTTPMIRDALLSSGMERLYPLIVPVGFPMVEKHARSSTHNDAHPIRVLFSGWMCSQLRSPEFFLQIVSRLDERFTVTFMGRECEKLTERFDIRTKAELITMPQQPYEVALQAMADADIMINIGNSVPVHMPSKTLEYINTGKPFVNFYKMDDCPTLYYTKRYPLCLNMSEKDTDLDAAARRFIDFCVENKGKTVDRDYIEREYEDCTPQYIAQKILDALGE